jgi:hypothetical protein
MPNNAVLEILMGDNVTCVVVIIIPSLAAGHTLTLETMTFADAAANEVTVYSFETQQEGQYILEIQFPFPCLACVLTITSRRDAWTGVRRRMMTTDTRTLQENTDTDAVTLDLSVNQAGTAASGFNWLLVILLLVLFLVMICCYMFATKKKEKKGQEVNPKSKQQMKNKI